MVINKFHKLVNLEQLSSIEAHLYSDISSGNQDILQVERIEDEELSGLEK